MNIKTSIQIAILVTFSFNAAAQNPIPGTDKVDGLRPTIATDKLPKFKVPDTKGITFFPMPKLGGTTLGQSCIPVGYKTQTKPNILINSDFAAQLPGYACPQTFTNPISSEGAGGGTCLQNWNTWGVANPMPDSYTLTTNLLTSTCPYGTGKMLHVKQSKNGAGIANQGFTENPAKAVASVWVYVVKGTIGLGIGNGGNTSNTVWTCQTGVWIYLETCNLDTQSPVTNFIMYNKNGGMEEAEFYIANPRVTKL